VGDEQFRPLAMKLAARVRCLKSMNKNLWTMPWISLMSRYPRRLVVTIAAITAVTTWPAVANAQSVCWPGVKVPPVEIPAVTIPAKQIPAREITIPTIPGGCVGDHCWAVPAIPAITIPAITIPAVSIPAFTIPAHTVPARCFDSETTDALPPPQTSVRVRNYQRVDSSFSLALSIAYWRQTGTSSLVPDSSAEGFAESTATGSVKNQYVRAYIRTNGTFVPGHWIKATSGGRPTCKIIHCKVNARR
jgi:hypothetical protein